MAALGRLCAACGFDSPNESGYHYSEYGLELRRRAEYRSPGRCDEAVGNLRQFDALGADADSKQLPGLLYYRLIKLAHETESGYWLEPSDHSSLRDRWCSDDHRQRA